MTSHRPRVADKSRFSTYRLNGHGKGDEYPNNATEEYMVIFTFPLQ